MLYSLYGRISVSSWPQQPVGLQLGMVGSDRTGISDMMPCQRVESDPISLDTELA